MCEKEIKNGLRDRLDRIHEDLKLAFIHEEGFELTKEDVSDISEFMDDFLDDFLDDEIDESLKHINSRD